MMKTRVREVSISGQEGHMSKRVKEGNDLLVLHTGTADILPDFTSADTLRLKQPPLTAGDILVKNVHSGGVYPATDSGLR